MDSLPQPMRDRFDRILDHILHSLPEEVIARLDEMPLIIEDEPDPELLEEIGMDAEEELFGLHTGFGLTERSVEDSAILPDEIRVFRGPIIRFAEDQQAEARTHGEQSEGEVGLDEQIRITVLHEIGHHYGLDEDDLDRLGYA
ncbi:MAG: metallopeptidase family protein [Phycisphaeraceae bacterium]